MNKKKLDWEILVIAVFLFVLCSITYFRVDRYYDKSLDGTKLQLPRYK